MRIINKTFIAGMLAMALVFGMAFASCEQETVTKEVTVPGINTTTPGANVPITELVAGGPEAVKAFLNGQLGDNVDTLYIKSSITLDGSGYTLGYGKTIVVTDTLPPPLNNTFALPEGGALFNITTPTGPVLTVKGTLTVKGKVTLGSETDYTQSGKLTIDSGAKVFVTSTGTVTATVSSEIALKDTTSTLSFEGTTATLKVVGTIDDGEAVVGTNTNTAIIVIPDGTPDLTIGIGNVKIGSNAANDTQLGGSGSFTGTSAAASTPKAVDDALKGSTTEVFYSGETSLGALEVPNNKTLVVTGDLKQEAALKVEGDLEIATGASIDLGTTGTITGDGTIDNQGTIKTANAEVLADLLDEKVSNGTVEVSGNVELTTSESEGETVAVPTGVSLKVADSVELKVGENVTLDLTALLAEDVGDESGALNGVVTIGGTIEVGSGGKLIMPAPSLADEVVYGSNGKLKLNAGSSAYIGEEGPYIGAYGAAAALTWTDENPTEGYVIIDNDGITLGGNGNLSRPTGDFYATGKITIEVGSVLTIGSTSGSDDGNFRLGNASGISTAELVLKGAVELNTTGHMYVFPNGKLTVATTGTIKHASTGSVNVRVIPLTESWVATQATLETESSVYTVTTATSDGVALDITLGTVKITSEAATAVNVNLVAAGTPAAGSLKAGSATRILFLGVAAAE